MIKLSEKQIRDFLQTPREKCRECGFEDFYLLDHLLEAHGMSAEEYHRKYPDAPVVSPFLQKLLDKEDSVERRGAPPPHELAVRIAGVKIPVNWDVPEDACLTLPDHYRVPKHGVLASEIEHVIIEFVAGTHLYIYGMPGAGKDALIQMLSACGRIPALEFSVNPDTDVKAWFHNRAFNKDGTYWEEGVLYKALVHGYTAPSGRKYPYLILLSDFDRADRRQAEFFRFMTDTIQGRVIGPTGQAVPIFPGTQVVATANTAGAGDPRGRMVSANPIDGSLLDRFMRFRLSWMDWKDEGPICKAKFPLLAEKLPAMFEWVGKATGAIREDINDGGLFTEFSHRGVCSWLKHAENIIRVNDGAIIDDLGKRSARVVLDAMPDNETREKVKRLIDPHLPGGMLRQGKRSTKRASALSPDFK
jgi:hypothetical protein